MNRNFFLYMAVLCTLFLFHLGPLQAQNEDVIHIDLSAWFSSLHVPGFDMNVSSTLELSTLMGEPVVKSSAAWTFSDPLRIAVHFVPYGETSFTTVYLTPEEARQQVRPYAFKVELEIKDGYYLAFDPGAISPNPGESSFNSSGSPDWNHLFYYKSKFDNNYLTKEQAIDLFKWMKHHPKETWSARLVDVKFDLTQVKRDYGMAQYEKRRQNYADAAKKYYSEVIKALDMKDLSVEDLDKEYKSYTPSQIKGAIESTMNILNDGKDQIDPKILSRLTHLEKSVIEKADSQSDRLKDCNASPGKISWLYEEEKKDFPKKDIVRTNPLEEMTQRVAQLINGHKTSGSTYKASVKSVCKIDIRRDTYSSKGKKSINRKGTMDLSTGSVTIEDSKGDHYRIITMKYQSTKYDIDLYYSEGHKKKNDFTIYAMDTLKGHEITDQILELEKMLPELVKGCGGEFELRLRPLSR
jgi:hypothetical protein